MSEPRNDPAPISEHLLAVSAGKHLPKEGERRVHCRRVQAVFTSAEHKDCPYCFGAEAAIQTGDHRKFCDFKPGEDPICFGFPEDRGHYGWR